MRSFGIYIGFELSYYLQAYYVVCFESTRINQITLCLEYTSVVVPMGIWKNWSPLATSFLNADLLWKGTAIYFSD